MRMPSTALTANRGARGRRRSPVCRTRHEAYATVDEAAEEAAGAAVATTPPKGVDWPTLCDPDVYQCSHVRVRLYAVITPLNYRTTTIHGACHGSSSVGHGPCFGMFFCVHGRLPLWPLLASTSLRRFWRSGSQKLDILRRSKSSWLCVKVAF